METAVVVVCAFAVLAAAWMYLRRRLEEVEERLRRLEWERSERPAVERPAPERPIVQTPAVQQPAWPVEEHVMAAPGQATLPVPPTPPPASVDWEAVLGGNWLNKLGVLIFVIGLALALGYSFTRLGPGGRVAISLCASLAMLAAGVVFESRDRYRNFARGLLGGGWAGLYTTVYAMQSIPAARIIDNALLGTALLMIVAAGMIAHSLRYRSQTVTAMAYFIAFGTLALTGIGWLSALALMPLAASLLYVAYRLEWRQIAVFGVLATWTVTLLRGDSAAGLVEAQAALGVYWLLFEVFDWLRPDLLLLPLNAAGALGISLLKWQSAAPGSLWLFFCGAAAAYAATTLVRAWRGAEFRPAATIAATLAAAAIFLRLHHQWIALGLLVEAELIYLTGWRLRLWYLRALGTALVVLHLGALLILGVGSLPVDAWVPIAAADVVLFYGNRLLCGDVAYGFLGEGMLALIVGYEAPEPWWGIVWLTTAAATFLMGWRLRLFDVRAQGYALAVLAAAQIALYSPHPVPALVSAATVGYAAGLCTEWLSEREAWNLRLAGSVAATFFVTQLVWIEVSGSLLTVAWGMEGAVLLAAGFPLRDRVLRISGLALLFGCILKVFLWDLRQLDTLPRILSFLVLGLILVAVSWVYTRFRERVARYL